MAEGKKSFVLYSDQRSIIELLSNEQAGVLLKHIFSYVNDENPIDKEAIIMLAFEPIKLQMKRDLIKWESTKVGRSAGGKASAEARRLAKETQQNLTNSTNVNSVEQTSTNPTVNDNVNVNVNVNETSDYYIVNGKIEKGNIVDWYLKNQQNIFEAELMKLNLSSQKERVISAFRNRFISGSNFNDYKHITNSFRKHIEEIEKLINKPAPKLIR